MAEIKYTEFEDRVIVVTGSGLTGNGKTNIGYESARIFSDAGAKTFIVDIDRDYGARAVDLIKQSGPKHDPVFYECDMGDKNSVERMVDHISENEVPYVFVSSAGIEAVNESFITMSDDTLERIVNVNQKGPTWVARRVIPKMVANSGGIIVLVGSPQGNRIYNEGSVYQQTKAAMSALAKAISFEYGNKGVRALNVMPGAIASGVMGSARGEFDQAAAMTIPMNRRGHPYEVAKVIAFMASDDASYMTGSDVLVEGGVDGAGSSTRDYVRQPNDPDQ